MAYADEARAAEPEDSRATYERRAERLRQIALQESWAEVSPAPHGERAAPLALARAVAPDLVCFDAPDSDTWLARVALALDRAYAQSGRDGARWIGEALTLAGDLSQGRFLVHGTGSWALAAIARDGALVPGGDGLTGEVALTHSRARDLYVCEGTDPASLYAAASFAYMNCAFDATRLELSAERAGARGVAEVFLVLLFGDDVPVLDARTERLARGLVRHRTLGMELALKAALERATELARRGELVGDGREHMRRLGTPDDAEAAFENVLAAIVERLEGVPHLVQVAAVERLARAVLELGPALERELLAPHAEDEPQRAAYKRDTLVALARQYPCVLVLDADGIEHRPAPSYAYSNERLVGQAIGLAALRRILVPHRDIDAARVLLAEAGVAPEIAALECFEAWRLVAECVAADAPTHAEACEPG